jgi:hypothetical protein
MGMTTGLARWVKILEEGATAVLQMGGVFFVTDFRSPAFFNLQRPFLPKQHNEHEY